MSKKIYITSFASISSLGNNSDEIWKNYCQDKSFISKKKIGANEVFVSKLAEKEQKEIERLQFSDTKYKQLDKSVLYAMYVSRKAIQLANWNEKDRKSVV